MEFYCFLIEIFCLSLNNGNSILRAMSETGAQTVAELLTRQLRLAINYLKGSFGTIRYTKAAAVAFLLINLDNLSLRHFLPPVSYFN
jgi:hypothetical protein